MSEWIIPLMVLPIFGLTYWTTTALYDFLRAYRATGERERSSTFPVEPAAFRRFVSTPVQTWLQTPRLTIGTLVAALHPHRDLPVERLRRRYLTRLVILLVTLPIWLAVTVAVFR